MAKKRRKKAAKRRTSTRTITKTRRVYVRKAHRRRRRGGGGGGRGMLGGMFSRERLEGMAIAAGIGRLEKAAKDDQSFILNTIVAKSPLPQLGFLGNVAVAASLANHFFIRNPWMAKFANKAADIAAYQFGRTGFTVPTSAAPFVVSGEDDDMLAGELDMGALASDADAHQLDGYDDDSMGALDDEIVDNIEAGQ